MRIEPLWRPSTAGFVVAPGLTVRLTTLGAPASFAAAAAAGTIDLSKEHLDANPIFEWGDGMNRPGNYSIRQIAGIRRLFGANISDNTILQAGTLRPPMYLEADNGPGLLKVREEVERWRLQNESAMVTAVRRIPEPYADVASAFVTPLQLATLGAHHRPAGSIGAVWQVRQVNHAWDDRQGYRQTIKASLWQGSVERTSGSAVRAISI